MNKYKKSKYKKSKLRRVAFLNGRYVSADVEVLYYTRHELVDGLIYTGILYKSREVNGAGYLIPGYYQNFRLFQPHLLDIEIVSPLYNFSLSLINKK
jgi:hypothetical protein